MKTRRKHQYPVGRPFTTIGKKMLGDLAFSNASAKVWNSLPQSLKSQKNLNNFKTLLKTLYFREVFNL